MKKFRGTVAIASSKLQKELRHKRETRHLFKVMKENCQPRILYHDNVPIKISVQ